MFYHYFKDFSFDGYDTGCEVFTVGGTGSHGSGRVIEEKCRYPVLDNEEDYPAFVIGVLHWNIGDNCNEGAEDDDVMIIVSFEMENEKFKIIPYSRHEPTCFSPASTSAALSVF